jgi:hypothetical protein
MRFDTKLPKYYSGDLLAMPPFKDEKITKRVLHGLENTLYLYSNLARGHSLKTDNNPKNFYVKEVYVVGSGARANMQDSDLDLMFICPEIDDRSANALKTVMSFVLFCDRPKLEAIDIFLRSKDAYPERDSVEITRQVQSLITKYNKVLDK